MKKESFLYSCLVLITIFLCFVGTLRAQSEVTSVRAAAWQVSRFDINARLIVANERALAARAAISARNVGNVAASTFTARISSSARIESVTFGEGAGTNATFTTRNDENTRVQEVRVTLPTQIQQNGNIQITFNYRLPVEANSDTAAISSEGAQFLPRSLWYPQPNSPFSLRGADIAPVRLTVTGLNAGQTLVASGRALTEANAFEQTLYAQPFFVTGAWETIEGGTDARGVSALIYRGAGADERRQANEIISLATAARAFFATTFGSPAPDVPVRIVSVRRGGGFDEARAVFGFDSAGTLLIDEAVFRRSKIDASVALSVAESMARLWLGGATPIRGEGVGAVRDGLARHLANMFIERRFGAEAAQSERLRQQLSLALIARRDAPLAQTTLLSETYSTTVANKGAAAWRLIARTVGEEIFISTLRAALMPQNREAGISLAGLRSALAERGGGNARALSNYLFDQLTDTDLLVGLPQQRPGGVWASALNNRGSVETTINVTATTDRGEQTSVQVTIPPRDFGEAVFRLPARPARVEIDPEKLYPQIDYANDVAPRQNIDPFVEASRAFQRADYPLAETKARQALSIAARREDVRVLLARALTSQNKLDEAEREFRSLLDAPLPQSRTIQWSLIGLGEIAQRRNQATEAARRFTEAVRADADQEATIFARAARIRAEGTSAPAPEESVRAFITQFDAAVLSGRKAAIDALLVPGELVAFSNGVVANQPETWQTRVLRAEALSGDSVAVDVSITTRALERDATGTAVFILARTGNGWKLADIRYFNVG
jgi:tetratricopeptide (TPR) repeat protein